MPKESKLEAMTMEKDEAFAINFCREMGDRVKRESDVMKTLRIYRIMKRVWIEETRMLEEIRKEASVLCGTKSG